MRNNKLIRQFGLFVIASLFAINFNSCKGDEKDNKESNSSSTNYTCIILNQGNYSEANGSISTIDEKGNITNQMYKYVNAYSLASIIESGLIDRGKLILICNNEDKIEVLNINDFKTLFTIKGIVTPRYGTIADGSLFVTSVPDWNKQEGYVYKINMSAAKIDTFIKLDGQPEGIITQNGKVVVGEGSKVKVINPTTLSIEKVVKGPSALSAKHFTKDKDNNVWVSFVGYDAFYNATGGISQLNFNKDSIDNFAQLSNIAGEGHLCTDPDKTKILYRTIVGAYTPDEKSGISSYDIATKSEKEIVSGDGFYGFNVDPKTGDIYTANINGWITNSTLLIYDAQGNAKSTDQTVGVGACRFLFQ